MKNLKHELFKYQKWVDQNPEYSQLCEKDKVEMYLTAREKTSFEWFSETFGKVTIENFEIYLTYFNQYGFISHYNEKITEEEFTERLETIEFTQNKVK